MWYCEKVKNITVTVDDETYRRARMKAAEQDTSVSALVKDFLRGIVDNDSIAEGFRREERALRERVRGFRASDSLARDHLYRRSE